MGWFEKTVWKRKANGGWVQESKTLEKAPTDFGRWAQSNELERKNGIGEKTYLQVSATKGQLNKKVTNATTYMPDGTKVERKLITTSNSLPKSYVLSQKRGGKNGLF